MSLEPNHALPQRRGPADRRLGERRLQPIPVTEERRAGSDRRGRTGRRESAAGHIRNALQMLETALAESELHHAPVDREYVAAAAERLQHALHEIDQLSDDRVTLGLLLRTRERGVPPESLPGLKAWLA